MNFQCNDAFIFNKDNNFIANVKKKNTVKKLLKQFPVTFFFTFFKPLDACVIKSLLQCREQHFTNLRPSQYIQATDTVLSAVSRENKFYNFFYNIRK